MSEITPNTPNPVREDAYVEELAEKLGIDPQYIPKSPVWRNEEEIRAIAEMFANMSGSSGGGVLVVHDVDRTLDKTWQEIHDGGFSVIKAGTDNDITYMPIITVWRDDNEYGVGAFNAASETPVMIFFIASSASGYPVYSE